MSEVVHRASHLAQGWTIAYPAYLRPEHKEHRSELTVVGFSEYGVQGKRVGSDDATVYTVYNRQLEDNGVLVLSTRKLRRPTRSEQSLEGAAVNGLTPVGQEARH